MNIKSLEEIFYFLVEITKVIVAFSLLILGAVEENSSIIFIGAFMLISMGKKEIKKLI